MCLSWRSSVTVRSSGVRSDGTGLVQLTSLGVNREPAWSPDGARIAFVRDQGKWDIYVMNADGSNVVRRTNGGWLLLACVVAGRDENCLFEPA